ncbi:hypothetical protein WMY93_018609 [Mugilogobius chulae]|uniref:Cadherin domain-containing protein n=1 Tax=Mugilogobius chulae TaxID=88201 RepID=A0AAW0NPC8_9GOBI
MISTGVPVEVGCLGFVANSTLRFLKKDTVVGKSVFTVNATDPDQGTGGSVLFSFQPPSDYFAIDGARGIVTVIKGLDYERTTSYQLTINATDQDKKKPLSRLANFAIAITDVQDMDPIFTNLPYSTNIHENMPLGQDSSPLRSLSPLDPPLQAFFFLFSSAHISVGFPLHWFTLCSNPPTPARRLTSRTASAIVEMSSATFACILTGRDEARAECLPDSLIHQLSAGRSQHGKRKHEQDDRKEM